MKAELLKKLDEQGMIRVREGFDSWEDAVRAAVEPLIETGAVMPSYAEDVVNNVKKYGPYICIVPHVCIPHALGTDEVNHTAMAFMKSNRPVVFGEGEFETSELFFALAAKDQEEHLENLSMLMEALDQEELVEKLCRAQSLEEIRQLAEQ